jgi:IS1 family transposase
MNQLSIERRAQIVRCLCDGNSLRATARIVDVSRVTVEKLLVELGEACREHQDRVLTGLTCKRLQVDELWGFCYAKQKNVPAALKGVFGFGDVWTFVGIDADTKLIASWRVGNRDAETANAFMIDLASRLESKVQLTTDGHRMYLQAVEDAFGCDIDFAQIQKIYSGLPDPGPENRYSPGQCCGVTVNRIEGAPNPKHVSTSYVERQNLTIRMNMRRMTRLTNGFSKKVQNLEHAMAIHFMHYNFVRVHQTLRQTPAMAAGITDRLWNIEDMLALLEKNSN